MLDPTDWKATFHASGAKGFGVGIALMALFDCPRARAQNAIYVIDDGAAHLVTSAVQDFPYYTVDGVQMAAAPNAPLGVKPAKEYRPSFVTVSNLDLTTGTKWNSQAAVMNLNMTLESPESLPNVVIVLNFIETPNGGVFIWGAGDLKAYKKRPIEFSAQTSGTLKFSKYRVFIFADGREVFTSQLKKDYVEAKLAQMVAARIAGDVDAPIRSFVAYPPEFPRGLRRSGATGSATVRVRVMPNGLVARAKVLSASDSDYGEAAVAAVKGWRFLPRVKDKKPVEGDLDVPFDFAAPKDN